MTKKLHIISFDIPYPADYGGVIDVFYKLKALHKTGIEITLHCFEYGNRKPNKELEKYCKQVFYYPRITGWRGLDATLPYIISSRRSSSLLKNLGKDEFPILFEGLHTTFYASHPSLKDRKKILRSHNIESSYYANLAKNASSWFKQLYYSFESNRLHHYENILPKFDLILSISEQDFQENKVKYSSAKHLYSPAFHSSENVQSLEGSGTYCLYHGNLSVDENKRSVHFLTERVFNQIDTPLIIAGKNPDEKIQQLNQKNIQVISNPSDEELQSLIQQAHVNVLPIFQESGLKLKLLNALYNGRHCLMNGKVESRLYETIEHIELNENWANRIHSLMQIPFDQTHLEKRKSSLAFYSPEFQAQQLLENIEF